MTGDPKFDIVLMVAALLLVAGCVLKLRTFFETLSERLKRKKQAKKQQDEMERKSAEATEIAIRRKTELEVLQNEQALINERREELIQQAASESEQNLVAIRRQCSIKKFSVSNGIGASRGAVVVEVQWEAPEGATLHILRNRGDVCRDMRELNTDGTKVRKLPISKRPPALNYVDRDVKNGKTYNYYVFVEAYFTHAKVDGNENPRIYRQSIARPLKFQAQSIGVYATETMIKGNKRRILEMESTLKLERASRMFQDELDKLKDTNHTDPLSEFKSFAKSHIQKGTVLDVTDQYRQYLINELGVTDEDEIQKLIMVFAQHKKRMD